MPQPGQQGSEGRGVILCFGDSHTKGTLGHNWVQDLSGRYPQYRFVNCGENGETTWSIAKRVRPVIIREQARPDQGPIVGVTFLGGGNDVFYHLNASGRMLVGVCNSFRMPIPSVRTYRQVLAEVFDTIRELLPNCPVAVMTLVPLGEDLAHPVHGAIARYNDTLRVVATQYNIILLDLHSSCIRSGMHLLIIEWALFKHVVLRRSWDDVAAARGARLLTDHIHLSDRGGALVVELVVSWLDDKVATPTITTPAHQQEPSQ